MSNTDWIKLYPDVFTHEGKQSVATNAFDGLDSIGKSGDGEGVLNCASTQGKYRKWKRLRYLELDLQRQFSVAAIQLHLRDGIGRQKTQDGLVVYVSNTAIRVAEAVTPGTQCGQGYNASADGQSPIFSCWTSGRYVYAVLRNSVHQLQVCEVQIFEGSSIVSVQFGPAIRESVLWQLYCYYFLL